MASVFERWECNNNLMTQQKLFTHHSKLLVCKIQYLDMQSTSINIYKRLGHFEYLSKYHITTSKIPPHSQLLVVL